MANSDKIGGARKTGIIRSGWKLAMESDSNGGPKCSSNIFSNDDEAKNLWGTLSKERGLKNVA